MEKQLRNYQEQNSIKGAEILRLYMIVYFAMQVRTGKTVTAMNTAFLYGAKRVLFCTKKKAIQSIHDDYNAFGFYKKFQLTIINNESIHKIEETNFDLVIMDEAHRFGSFPKPSEGAKNFKIKYGHLPIIFLSGTPHPESYSQVYHQFWVSNHSPFKQYKNFYNWFTGMGFVKCEFDLGYGLVTNYTNNKEIIHKYYSVLKRKISKEDPNCSILLNELSERQDNDINRMQQANKNMDAILDKYFIKFSQQQAGFTSEVKEHVLTVKMKPITYHLIERISKDRVIKGKDETILADTAVKLMGKIHQLCSGTIKFEKKLTIDDNKQVIELPSKSKIIDESKAEYIKEFFKEYKIGIFYKFKEELNLLKSVFQDELCTDLDTFNTTNKNIALQVISGREGISLKEADYLVFFNIDFSAISYFQAKDRLTTIERKTNDVYWVFAEGGIEEKIYKTVMGKKDYTLSKFVKDYGIKAPNKIN